MRRYLLLIVSIVVFCIELCFIRESISFPITYIPLIFGFFSLIPIHRSILSGPGVKVALFVMCLRYLVMPPMLLISGYFTYDELIGPDMNKSFLLIIIEMATIFLTLSLTKRKQYEILNIEGYTYSYLFPLALLLLAIYLSIKDPIPLSRYHFILSGADELFDTDLEDSTQGLPRFLAIVHSLLIVSVISLFYHFYNKKKIVVYYWLGLAVSILISCFYQDTSRNSMLIPLLSIMFLNSKIYKQHRKKTTVIVLVVVVLSMLMLTLLKQFQTKTISSANINEEDSSIILERYFGGVVGVYDGFTHELMIKSKIDSQTLVVETFGKVIFLNRILDQTNRTSNFYNDSLGSRSFIIPTISEGYFHFSWFFCWLFTFVIFKLILLFDKLFATTRRIDLAFVFVSLSVTLGWMHTGNFIICMNSFHMSMILLLVFYLNVILSRFKIH